MPSVWLDESLITSMAWLVLDICNEPLIWSRGGCSITTLGSSSFLCGLLSDLGQLCVVDLKLPLVDRLLLDLGLLLLGLLAPLSNLLEIELVLSLHLVRCTARAQQAAQEDDRKEEAADRVPGKSVRGHDTEGENAPPVQSITNPECEEGKDNPEDVKPGVLVNTLVIRFVDWVVSVAIAGKL